MNYKHLHYFWVVAKTGGVNNASEVMHITPQTISGQISLLEEAIGTKLFQKQGRKLALTNQGKKVFKYADAMFSLGEELEEYLKGADSTPQSELRVGVMDCVPKIIASKVLSPIIEEESVNLVCSEGSFDQLVSKLAIRELDMVISDMPISTAYSIKAYNHKFGESALSCFAKTSISKNYKEGFPANLDKVSMLLPTANSTIRPAIDQWLMSINISPNIVGEFDDSALLKTFGEAGAGLFFMPTIIEKEICNHYDVVVIGRVEQVKEQFYALTLERNINKGLSIFSKIYNSAKNNLFQQ